MTKGRLSGEAGQAQGRVENPMALIGGSLARLEHDSLRVRQAIRRAGLEDLLEEVLSDHQRISRDLRRVQAYLRVLWEAGQAARWDMSWDASFLPVEPEAEPEGVELDEARRER